MNLDRAFAKLGEKLDHPDQARGVYSYSGLTADVRKAIESKFAELEARVVELEKRRDAE